jgi:hypothetical protein
MYLIHDGDWSELSPEEMQQGVQKYIDWVRILRERGQFVEGDELKAGGRMIDAQGDGPFSETKETIGGYFVIAADSLEHALQIARECPTYDHGGRVQIRPISEGDTEYAEAAALALQSASQFALLIGTGKRNSLSDSEKSRVRDWGKAWIDELRQSGAFIKAYDLELDGRKLSRSENEIAESEMPAPDEQVSAVVFFSAPDLESAISLAKGCPAGQHGGYLQVREINQNPGG